MLILLMANANLAHKIPVSINCTRYSLDKISASTEADVLVRIKLVIYFKEDAYNITKD